MGLERYTSELARGGLATERDLSLISSPGELPPSLPTAVREELTVRAFVLDASLRDSTRSRVSLKDSCDYTNMQYGSKRS